jgi:hypothetical protein
VYRVGVLRPARERSRAVRCVLRVGLGKIRPSGRASKRAGQMGRLRRGDRDGASVRG